MTNSELARRLSGVFPEFGLVAVAFILCLLLGVVFILWYAYLSRYAHAAFRYGKR